MNIPAMLLTALIYGVLWLIDAVLPAVNRGAHHDPVLCGVTDVRLGNHLACTGGLWLFGKRHKFFW